MEGWIKLHRSIIDWEWYDDVNVFRLFTHLLLSVNYEDKKWHGQTIERGSIVTSRLTLAEETGLSEQQVRTALNKLKTTREITTKSTKQYTIITINNYDIYQMIDINEQPTKQPTSNQRITNEQPTNNQRATTTKEIKKERNKEYINNPYNPLQGELFDDQLVNQEEQIEEISPINNDTAEPLRKEKSCGKKEKKVLNIEPIIADFPAALQEGLRRWVEYKAVEKGEKYKSEMTFRAFCTRLHTMANGDVDTMLAMIEQAIANGWKGIYELKNNFNTKRNGNECGNVDIQRIVECGFAMARK